MSKKNFKKIRSTQEVLHPQMIRNIAYHLTLFITLSFYYKYSIKLIFEIIILYTLLFNIYEYFNETINR